MVPVAIGVTGPDELLWQLSESSKTHIVNGHASCPAAVAKRRRNAGRNGMLTMVQLLSRGRSSCSYVYILYDYYRAISYSTKDAGCTAKHTQTFKIL